MHFIIEYFLNTIFSHIAALPLTLARPWCLQGIRRQRSQASKLPLCQPLVILVSDYSHQWDGASEDEFFTCLLSQGSWTTPGCWQTCDLTLLGLATAEAKKPIAAGNRLPDVIPRLSALSFPWYWHVYWSVHATEIRPWEGEWGGWQDSLPDIHTALWNPLIKHVTDIWNICSSFVVWDLPFYICDKKVPVW